MKNFYQQIVLIVVFCCATTATFAQTATLYRSGVLAGSFSTIQSAIDAIPYPSSTVDSITLSPHTFYEHDIDVSLKPAIIIKGLSINSSKIDAQSKGRIFTTRKGYGAILTFEDVVMQNGYTTGNGGGIYYDYAALSQIILRGNTILRNCHAKGNGGGIYYVYKLYLQGNAKIMNNKSDSMGGGVVAYTIKCTDSPEISGNSAKFAGAGWSVDYHTPITNLKVLNNYASDNGGAFTGILTLDNVIMKGNKAGKKFNNIGYFYDVFGVPEKTLTSTQIIQLTNSYIYNPDSNGKRNYEINGEFLYFSSGNWFGNSDTARIIQMNPVFRSSAIANYVVAKWQLNRGKTLTAKDTIFPVQAGFRLNTGAALPAGSCRWLEGNFRATGGGAFIDSTSKININDTVQSFYRSFIAGPTSKSVDFLAWVDADTFRTTRIVWGRDTTTKKDTTTSIAIEHLNELKVFVYPNPAKDVLFISGSPMGGKARLYDALGKQVIYHPIISEVSAMPVHNLPAGTYFLRITASNGAVGTAKVMKE